MQAIVAGCSGLPLALAVAGARLRRRPGAKLGDFAAAIAAEGDRLDALDDHAGTIRGVLESGMRAASTAAQRLLMLVAALDVVILKPDLLAALMGVSNSEARRLLEELEAERLLTSVEDGGWQMHDLLRACAQSLATERLTRDDLSSAQQRRVTWLVKSAQSSSAPPPTQGDPS